MKIYKVKKNSSFIKKQNKTAITKKKTKHKGNYKRREERKKNRFCPEWISGPSAP